MNRFETWLDAEERTAKTEERQTLMTVFSGIWQRWMKWMMNLGEVQVRHRTDRAGNSYWQAYNPLTGRSLCSGSELEIRLWIEQQLHQ